MKLKYIKIAIEHDGSGYSVIFQTGDDCLKSSTRKLQVDPNEPDIPALVQHFAQGTRPTHELAINCVLYFLEMQEAKANE